MPEPIAPALTPDEWARAHALDPQPDGAWSVDGLARSLAYEPHPAPLTQPDAQMHAVCVALHNDALPDDSPYKLRSRHVAALTNVVQGYRDEDDLGVLDELASILTALLPPK